MSKYAIVEITGHQYWVEENSLIKVEKLDTEIGKECKLEQVLLFSEDGDVKVGQPYVGGASVVCDVLKEERQPKVMSFKFRRREGYRRRVGHRQNLFCLKVKSIQLG